jgi:hypothetical protein
VNDLAADLSAELGAPRAVAATPRRPVPAVTVVLTPLHWSRPSVAAAPGGAGVVLHGGPWQVEVLV